MKTSNLAFMRASRRSSCLRPILFQIRNRGLTDR